MLKQVNIESAVPFVTTVAFRERRDMSEDELREVYSLYTECWKLFREYNSIKTDQEWEKLDRITRDMVKKYGDYSISMIMATICLIERRVKNGTVH